MSELLGIRLLHSPVSLWPSSVAVSAEALRLCPWLDALGARVGPRSGLINPDPSLLGRSACATCEEHASAPPLVAPQLRIYETDSSKKLDSPFFWLAARDGALGLQSAVDAHGRPFYVDFCSTGFRRRRKSFGARDLLARAVGGRRSGVRLCDATLGWGYDSVLLASLGYTVTACERSPVVLALAYDAFLRAKVAEPEEALWRGMEFVLGPAEALSPGVSFEVVYLDPMYPEVADRSALPKKKMQLLRRLLPEPEPIDGLLSWAQSAASERVVLKRADHAAGTPHSTRPSQVIEGETVRFEVFRR